MFSHIARGAFVLTLSSISIVIGSAIAPPAVAAGTVEIELLTERGFPAESTHDWLKRFADLGVQNIRIRAAQAGDEPSLRKRGSDKDPVYSVVGILGANGTLHLPGGRFSAEQSRQIGAWLKNLQDNGPNGENKKKVAAFGLSEDQFARVTSDLEQTVGVSTKGKRIDEAVAKISATLKHRLVIDRSAQTAMAGEVVLDELSGMSSGTALAAAIRPAGLILVPKVSGSEVELVIAPSRGAKELWPIGWESEKAPGKLLPGLVKSANVEIEDTALADALPAVAKRLEAPLLFDHNNLAKKNIDLAKTNVTLPAERLIYSTVLRRMLYQARLKYEVRVDDAGKPFLWITPGQ